ncbi:MAG: TetR/AcrR family transcriptional regulator [Myxococcales bacterium]|nr:TetR/AcrR family transcriptional regulator [Myxococcales bacterium]
MSRSYADVTIDQVAADASVTKGAVYHHFSSKEHLYLTMLQLDLADKRRIYEEAIAPTGTSKERLRRLTEKFLNLSETKQNLIGLVRRDINIFEEETRTALVQAYQEALPNLVEDVIRDGIRDEEVVDSDPRLLAWQFVATVEVTLAPYARQQLTSDESKVNHVISLFFGGCARSGSEERR